MAVSFDGPGRYRLEPAGRLLARVAARRCADAVGHAGGLAFVGAGGDSWC